ncbi:hypothetical protein ABT071_38055 [Streptomyces sp. NPDC002506]|uniref:hypothetical protein n=1 Tax=Streptomyces sp. NPDC002506 TaxID=3154536 RepID=UPI00333081DB
MVDSMIRPAPDPVANTDTEADGTDIASGPEPTRWWHRTVQVLSASAVAHAELSRTGVPIGDGITEW